MGKTKRRIDKKNSVTFKLVNRSQRDPLIADETAPQHVLVECTPKKDDASRKEEQRKFGIYFDDEYDYLQHLKDVRQVGSEWQQLEKKNVSEKKVLLPSSVFASHVEEEDGMLNKAALPCGPLVDWDPDVVAALDEDFDYNDPNNIIDDDFVTQAMCSGDESQEQSDDESVTDDASEIDSEDERSFHDIETKSHFTNYSVTSSVLRRNEGLKLLDERFETLYEQEYAEDNDIGALDLENIEGNIDVNKCPLIQKLIEESEAPQKEEKSSREHFYFNNFDEESEVVEFPYSQSKHQRDNFDCESILSQYSNLYNHPKLIVEHRKLKINPKTGVAVRTQETNALTKHNLKKLDAANNIAFGQKDLKSERSVKMSELSIRSRDETPEERKARKQAFKELKRERKEERKANRTLFKEEQIRQNKEMLNVRNRLKAVKLV
ncbi:protein LTV1-like protein [Leptotrombidium deliense]|uniref:Protein LTV1 homolog n=1 Tax=Leptotrombidium deliense TaxID=299467 RepID=A0A443S4X7_9ACAR|nr:protein LTV1-like protein [Leptotrombidium deliense]